MARKRAAKLVCAKHRRHFKTLAGLKSHYRSRSHLGVKKGAAKKSVRAAKKPARAKATPARTRYNSASAGVKLLSPPFLIRFTSRRAGQPHDDRPAVIVQVPTVGAVAFYQSTGKGSPGLAGADRGDWVPFNGISRVQGGWFIKIPGKVPDGALKAAARFLQGHVKRPTRIFDSAAYTDASGQQDRTAFYHAVNTHLRTHGALRGRHDIEGSGGLRSSRHRGPFAFGTVNFKGASATAAKSRYRNTAGTRS